MTGQAGVARDSQSAMRSMWIAGVVVATVAVYWPSLNAGFVGDDFMTNFKRRVDDYVSSADLDVPEPEREAEPAPVPQLSELDLRGEGVTAILWAFADPIVDDIFGTKYAAAVPWLGPLSLAMLLYALATVYLYHFLSLARARFALVLVAIQAAQLVAFAVLHGSPSELIGVQITAAAVSVVAAEAWYLLRGRPPA